MNKTNCSVFSYIYIIIIFSASVTNNFLNDNSDKGLIAKLLFAVYDELYFIVVTLLWPVCKGLFFISGLLILVVLCFVIFIHCKSGISLREMYMEWQNKKQVRQFYDPSVYQ